MKSRIFVFFLTLLAISSNVIQLHAMEPEITTVEISTIPMYVIPSSAFTPADVRERWEGKISLRGTLAQPMLTLVQGIRGRKAATTVAEYGSVRWRIYIVRGKTIIADWYVDKQNAVFLDDKVPYAAPPELIRLLDRYESELKWND